MEGFVFHCSNDEAGVWRPTKRRKVIFHASLSVCFGDLTIFQSVFTVNLKACVFTINKFAWLKVTEIFPVIFPDLFERKQRERSLWKTDGMKFEYKGAHAGYNQWTGAFSWHNRDKIAGKEKHPNGNTKKTKRFRAHEELQKIDWLEKKFFFGLHFFLWTQKLQRSRLSCRSCIVLTTNQSNMNCREKQENRKNGQQDFIRGLIVVEF